MHGFLLIDKTEDWTSHDVVGYLRGVLGIKKIGHAGTLDPFATGLLIVGIGRGATKKLDSFKNLHKTYEATIALGATSDTQDPTGTIVPQEIAHRPELSEIKVVLNTFLGKQTQIPPMHSAKKIDGTTLYKLARKGVEIERKPHEIEIFDIALLNYHFPEVTINIECSVGTYIRTLAEDIGTKLDTGAYCKQLRRTRIGTYDIKKATPPKQITADNIQRFLFDI